MQGDTATALMIAVKKGNCQMITLLLNHGADINAVNEVRRGSNATTFEVSFMGLIFVSLTRTTSDTLAATLIWQ